MEWNVVDRYGKPMKVQGDTLEEARANYASAMEMQIHEEYSNLPWYGKALGAANDLTRIGLDEITFGQGDRAAAWMGGLDYEEEKRKTEEARIRSGSAAIAPTLWAGWKQGKFIPSAAPAVTEKVGGPALVRGATRVATGTAENAALSGAEGAARGEDPWEWAQSGAVSGLAGTGLTGLLSLGTGIYDAAKAKVRPKLSGLPMPQLSGEAMGRSLAENFGPAVAPVANAIKTGAKGVGNFAGGIARMAGLDPSGINLARMAGNKNAAPVEPLPVPPSAIPEPPPAPPPPPKVAEPPPAKDTPEVVVTPPPPKAEPPKVETPAAPKLTPLESMLKTVERLEGEAAAIAASMKGKNPSAITLKRFNDKVSAVKLAKLRYDAAVKRDAENAAANIGATPKPKPAPAPAAEAPAAEAAPPPKPKAKAVPPKEQQPLGTQSNAQSGRSNVGSTGKKPKAEPKPKPAEPTPEERRAEAMARLEEIRAASKLEGGPLRQEGYETEMHRQMKDFVNNKEFMASFTPEERKMITRLYKGDIATNAGKALSRLISYPTIMGGIAGGGSLLSNIGELATAAAATGIPALGYGGRAIKNTGASRRMNDTLSELKGRTPSPTQAQLEEMYKAIRSLSSF